MNNFRLITFIIAIAMVVWSCSSTEDEWIEDYGEPEDYDWLEVYEPTPTDQRGLSLFLPENVGDSPVPAVLILPGGCYYGHATNTEGIYWVPFMLKLGFAAAVLEYDLPEGNPEVTMNHANRVINYLRSDSRPEINCERVGVMGFSAGGHLAALLSTQSDVELRPAFQVEFYPVISMEDEFVSTGTHALCRWYLLGDDATRKQYIAYSANRRADADTPPAFIAVGTADNVISPDNSRIYARSLSALGVDNVLLEAPRGGHGCHDWVNLTPVRKSLRQWLKDRISNNDNSDVTE